MLKGLIIRQPWIDLILSGKKTWEMRSKANSRPSEKIDVEPTATQPPTPEVRTDNNGHTLNFRPETAQAYGRPLPDGRFLVFKDSTAMRSGSPNVKRDAHDRDRLVREGVLVPDGANRYRFTRDHAFSSSSKAAGIIKDGNASGPSLWKHVKSGRSLKDSETLGSEGVAR